MWHKGEYIDVFGEANDPIRIGQRLTVRRFAELTSSRTEEPEDEPETFFVVAPPNTMEMPPYLTRDELLIYPDELLDSEGIVLLYNGPRLPPFLEGYSLVTGEHPGPESTVVFWGTDGERRRSWLERMKAKRQAS